MNALWCNVGQHRLPEGETFCGPHQVIGEARQEPAGPVQPPPPPTAAGRPPAAGCWDCGTPPVAGNTSCLHCGLPLVPPDLLVEFTVAGTRLRVTVGRGDEVVLGRDPGASPHGEQFAHSEFVSKQHAVLSVDAGGSPWVRDLDSTNFTAVNGVRIVTRTRLRDGDEISFSSDAAGRVRLPGRDSA